MRWGCAKRCVFLRQKAAPLTPILRAHGWGGLEEGEVCIVKIKGRSNALRMGL